ncbi:MAG TPA: EcsC family protein [Sphingobacteriaceae bacterium]
MDPYEHRAFNEMRHWQQEMQKRPSFTRSLSKKIQDKMNSYIPDKIHRAVTVAIQKMIETVLFGARLVSAKPLKGESLIYREAYVREKIDFYTKTAVTEGAITGAGGILLGLADFPLLLTLKMKMLYDIAALYGCNIEDYRERIYFLYIFQLAFSSQKSRNETYKKLENWHNYSETLPENIREFDWKVFQQEYRDYIDLAKLAQLIPVIGAAVGAVANYQLIRKLGDTAKNAYRMRYFNTTGSFTKLIP